VARLGVAPCLELLVDLPTYFAKVQGPGNSGFSDVSPALKWQISPIPGKIDLSVVFGMALPTGAVAITGRGAQPYQLTEQLSLFTEYVGDYPDGAGPSLLLNSGAVYHMNRTEQIDFRIAFGLNHNAPSYIVGVGYSFRFDGLFASHPW